MKRNILLVFLVIASAPAVGTAAVCPMRFVFELLAQLVPARTFDLDGRQLPPAPRPPFPPDIRWWGIDDQARDRAVDSFVRHFGRELRGVFLVGAGDAYIGFVVLVRTHRSHRGETDLVRADLRERFGDVPIDVYGVITGCHDCPLRTRDIPVALDGTLPMLPVIGNMGCALALELDAEREAMLLWPPAIP